MTAADDALREAAKAEQARYSRPFVEGPKPGTRTPPATQELLDIARRRAELVAAVGERHLEAVQVIA